MTYTIRAFIGTKLTMLTPFGMRSRLSSHSGNVSQFQAMPSFIDSYGICSVRVIMSSARSRSAGFTGAKPKPQLPSTSEVTPCQPDTVQYGSQWIWAS